ncbi:cytochrome b-c1 complex subunit 7-like [Oppia nitens]|uniref:cytochrome b-c1 complex subunit 7-like n=1 Tax=Oppia nitens TaxID=1686743 RepID=UPI0023D9C3A5|nr:cytochrome b-c1 complex subunit 7-like [Oppia nitens]
MVRVTGVLRQWIKHKPFRKWYYNLQGYNKFGLYQNDFLCLGVYTFHPSDEPLYDEALRRLPPDEYDQYVYRNIRSQQLEITKAAVPLNERPTFEEDETKGRFLEPYIREILKEKKEKEQWQEFLMSK